MTISLIKKPNNFDAHSISNDEKLYELFLSRAKLAGINKLGDYFKGSPSFRVLHCDKYLEQQSRQISLITDYNSQNFEELSKSDMENVKLRLWVILKGSVVNKFGYRTTDGFLKWINT